MAAAVRPCATLPDYLGPAVDGAKRSEKLKLSDNETVSVVPRHLLNFPVKVAARDGQLPVYNCRPPVEMVVHYPAVDSVLLQELAGDIMDYFETALQNQFCLFALVWRTNLLFTGYKTQQQAGTAAGSGRRYAAAHCSLVQNVACQGVMFAKNSSFMLNCNATVILPRIVNDAQTDLDHSKGLQRRAIAILNDVAAGGPEANPHQAMGRLVDEILELVQGMLAPEGGKGRKKPVDEPTVAMKKQVLTYFRRVALAYQRELRHGAELIKQLGCLARHPSPVDESFFMALQGVMHGLLRRQMAAVQRSEALRLSDATELTPSQQKYVKCCTVSEAVRQLAQRYFAQQTAAVQQQDLARLRLLGKGAKVDDGTFSPAMQELYRLCCATMVASRPKKKGVGPAKKAQPPKAMCVLMPRLLKELRPAAPPAPPHAAVAPPPRAVARPTPARQVAAAPPAPAPQAAPPPALKGRAKVYAEFLAADVTVRQAAQRYFAATTAATQREDLRLVATLGKSSTVHKIALSPPMRELYNACMTALRAEHDGQREFYGMSSIMPWVVRTLKPAG